MTWASSTPITWEQANFTWVDNVIDANKRRGSFAGTPEGFMVIIAP